MQIDNTVSLEIDDTSGSFKTPSSLNQLKRVRSEDTSNTVSQWNSLPLGSQGAWLPRPSLSQLHPLLRPLPLLMPLPLRAACQAQWGPRTCVSYGSSPVTL